MESTLQNLAAALPSLDTAKAAALAQSVFDSLPKIRSIQYSCIGCEHCYLAVIQNALVPAFPALAQALDLRCEFRFREDVWAPVMGEYFVRDKAGAVAVSTLAGAKLAGATDRI